MKREIEAEVARTGGAWMFFNRAKGFLKHGVLVHKKLRNEFLVVYSHVFIRPCSSPETSSALQACKRWQILLRKASNNRQPLHAISPQITIRPISI
jgi:hypothetical protein